MIRRAFATEFEYRIDSQGVGTIEGHAAVFNSTSRNLGGFVEQVDPAAFNRTLSNGADVRALINHDSNLILGRSVAGTLDLSTDEYGLAYRVGLPDTSYARDLAVSLERGDISQSSFGFRVRDDEWSETEQGYPLRTLREVDLNNGDVSPVTFPAYEATDVGARSEDFSLLAKRTGHDVDDLVAAAGRNELRALLSDVTDPTTPPAGGDDGWKARLRDLDLELQRRKVSPIR